ncbi:HpsJ family protein [Parathermosynechococcus lividus]
MTASKSTKRPLPLAAQFLKLVGIILLLTFFVEWGLLFVSPQFSNNQWQLTVVNQFIERGATPLIGFVFIYTGFWIQAVSGNAPQVDPSQSALKDWRFWVFVLSSLLGLLCLLGIPLYLSITGQITEQAVNQINQEAAQAEIRVDQEQQQIKQLASSGQLEQILQSGQLPTEQKAILQQLKNDPQALDRQAGQARERIRAQQQEAVERAQQEALINRLRVSIRSFLLAIGFITIGWSGLREQR